MPERNNLERIFSKVGVPGWHILHGLDEQEGRSAEQVASLVGELYDQARYPSVMGLDVVRLTLFKLTDLDLVIGRRSSNSVYRRTPLGTDVLMIYRRLQNVLNDQIR